MSEGVGMPVAWVQLALQRERLQEPDAPGLIFLPELGQVTLGHLDKAVQAAFRACATAHKKASNKMSVLSYIAHI